jgi:hypothetical protein
MLLDMNLWLRSTCSLGFQKTVNGCIWSDWQRLDYILLVDVHTPTYKLVWQLEHRKLSNYLYSFMQWLLYCVQSG